MKIMVFGWEIPATSMMPGSPRAFSLCRSLSTRHRLTLVAFSHGEEQYQAFRDDPTTRGVFEDIVILPNPPVPTWWHTQVHRLRQEAHFITRHRHPRYHAELCEKVGRLLLEGDFDVVYGVGLVVAQYVMDAKVDCPAVIDVHDSLTLLLSRVVPTEERWVRRLALLSEMWSIARWEKSLSRRFEAIITVSRVDEAFFRSLDPAANVITIDSGVDSEFFTVAGGSGDLTRLVFTGVMDYRPNEDAVIYFCNSILPLIQRRFPHVEFWVVGKDPTEKVQMLAQRPGVHVTGGVPDVRPYIENAGIFVCPLRLGAGVKNKILAALAMQKAVVATRLSLEGLALKEEEHVIAADDPQKFADGVVRLIEEPDLAARLGRAGQAFVRAEYSWERSAMQLEDVLRNAIDHHRARR